MREARIQAPGAKTIPEFIARETTPYYQALESADAAWRKGALDLSEMGEFLKSSLAARLVDVLKQASVPTNRTNKDRARKCVGRLGRV